MAQSIQHKNWAWLLVWRTCGIGLSFVSKIEWHIFACPNTFALDAKVLVKLTPSLNGARDGDKKCSFSAASFPSFVISEEKKSFSIALSSLSLIRFLLACFFSLQIFMVYGQDRRRETIFYNSAIWQKFSISRFYIWNIICAFSCKLKQCQRILE